MSDEPVPTLRVRDEDVFLGEEVVFQAGLRCAAKVPARMLYGRARRIVVRAPDGSETVHERERSSYDGPSEIKALHYCECLNDLAAPLVPGTYELVHQCDGREARQAIRVREPSMAGPAIRFEFPARLDVTPGAPFTARVEVTNASRAPLRIVEPNSTYPASVVGFVDADDPPSWSRLERADEWAAEEAPRYRTPVDFKHLGELAIVECAPGERRTYDVAFLELFRKDDDRAWRPRGRLEVTLGLVAHAFEPDGTRPIRWLRRGTGEYLLTGERISAGEARCKPWQWCRVTPSG
jgi:hypothetical protein